MKSDIEIAQASTMLPIVEVADQQLGIPSSALEPHGHYKAKLSLSHLKTLSSKPDGKLILVTAISPTPAGEGKTTTTVGLGDALNRIGKKTVIALREPSLGPAFGVKGGAAGGGFAQVVPMEDINLHFTGDFNAIALANNLLAAMLDNHIHQGNALNIDVNKIAWRRVMDMNDRALRDIVIGLGGSANGTPRESGFDIVVASEVMAVLCLADSLADLKKRLGNIVVGYSRASKGVASVPITATDLGADGAMTVLLRDAIKPNIVQTLENNPAILHGGPFANIAHGCNSVIATRAALKMGEYVVTEAGFGADLGAEKFIDIKCRKSGLVPSAVVVVATVRALKFHGGVALAELSTENLAALASGMSNLERHVRNIREVFGLPCVVSINHRTEDTEAEVQAIESRMKALGVPVVVAMHWAKGGVGAEALAHQVVELAQGHDGKMNFVYPNEMPLWDKMRAVATKIYGASDISASAKVRAEIERLQTSGYGHFPVCVAKTQMSFSTDPTLKGAPSGHTVNVREVRLAAGAEFVVMVCGDIMTMPGLPKEPAALRIDIDDDGKITGLF
jgi:formate--tetrahydrofolate ligase